MEEETKTTTRKKKKSQSGIAGIIEKSGFWKGMALILFGIIILTQVFDITITPRWRVLSGTYNSSQTAQAPGEGVQVDALAISREVLPQEGVELPIEWGSLGKKMIADGVIDEQKFRALFEEGLSNADENILTGTVSGPIKMDESNSRFILDVLWAFGLANKNEILEKGEMTDAKYGGDASKFASTGGWTLAKGTGFDHYSQHNYVNLTAEQQALVAKVAQGIYRPCCGNSTHFPDCNHGMAMLGLLELMAANGVNEKEMYRVALLVNSFWFPQTYIDLATYFEEQGQAWSEVDPQTVLSAQYSSAQGYQQTRQLIKSLPKPQQGGGGCGA